MAENGHRDAKFDTNSELTDLPRNKRNLVKFVTFLEPDTDLQEFQNFLSECM